MSRPSRPAFKAQGNSFKFAFRGLLVLLQTQRNARVHLLATALAIGAGVYFDITEFEWCGIIFAIALVWITEALNTALEFLADATMPKHHDLVGKAKDVAAAAVLVAAIAALFVGLLIFGPAIAVRFGH
jgi:diacylglycerol kinase